ncbi:MAG: hypothetical protein D6757_05310 [Alphaproteobacteria bacterium]|nr:MAG: hypothetical protein D6757_05310 [Alphaproteobacteria bacterium]
MLIRLHAIDRPRRHAIAEVRRRSRACRPPSGIAGDLAEALMDLGSSLCTARGRPDCSACPLHQHCEAARRGTAGQLPRRAETRERRKMAALVFCIQGPAGEVLLARRPADGLLGGMWAMPMSTPVSRDEFDPDALIRKARWRSIVFASLPRPVRHLFTHIDLQAHVVRADVPCPADIVLREGERWWPAEAARDVLPALMRKALDRAGSG